jgi:hypothetical protein
MEMKADAKEQFSGQTKDLRKTEARLFWTSQNKQNYNIFACYRNVKGALSGYSVGRATGSLCPRWSCSLAGRSRSDKKIKFPVK